jgi:hypothetical protein
MTITQTVEIPADRRLTIDVPQEVPTGQTSVIIQFPFLEETPAKKRMTEAEEMELINRNADRLNAEAIDVLSYQDINL